MLHFQFQTHHIPERPNLPTGRTRTRYAQLKMKASPTPEEPVLKIEEEDISQGPGQSSGGSSVKKGSTSTVWTSEESILRGALTVDEDNK